MQDKNKIKNIAVIIVTYNRASLLSNCIDSILVQDCTKIGAIYIIDNASDDNTEQVVSSKKSGLIKYICINENKGGAGGFKLGIKTAYLDGFEWIWVLDDDVYPANNCLSTLVNFSNKYKILIPVRENKNKELEELSAIEYNLSNPFLINPKVNYISQEYKSRKDLPPLLEVVNFSFEGLFIHKDVISKVGFPNSDFFIFYDDVDFALRIKKQGYKIYALRDAILVRQLEFDQKASLNSWKSYYMYRNFFIIHFLYGENIFVKIKPFIMTFFGILLKKFISYNPPTIKSLKDALLLAKKFKKFR